MEGGRERGIYSGGTKAPVGGDQPVPKVIDQYRLDLPIGAYVQGQHWHRVVPPPGAIDVWLIWYRLMDLTGAFVSTLASVCAMARLASARRKPRVPAIDAAGADVFH